MSGTHVLYRFYSATGQLLYVGITMNPPVRFKAHHDDKDLDELPGGWKNPAGVVEFDDTDLARLNSWQQLSQAMNSLYMEAGSAGTGDHFNQEAHDGFVAAMGRLARSICYMDACPECAETAWVAPHKTFVPGGSMCAYYRCEAGHEWFKWHTLRDLFREQVFAGIVREF